MDTMRMRIAGRGLVAVGLLAAPLMANAQQGVPSQAPAPIRQLGGVPSQPARMISIGGQGGIPLNRTRTLLPPDAAQPRQRSLSPSRDYNNGLVRPIYGPGPERGVPAGTGGGLYNPPGRGGDGTWYGNGPWTYDGRGYHDGTGVDGSYRDDHWKLRFHLGAGSVHYPSSFRYYFPLSWYRSAWRYDYDYPQVVYSGPWYGTDPFVTQGMTAAQQAAQAAPPRELTAVERAEAAWRADQYDEATRWFREHLEREPKDADAMRYLAMVLIDDRRVEQGVAMMAMAYEMDPKLASKPLPVRLLPDEESGQRRRVVMVSTYANRVKSGSAWMTLAVLMQSEGRDSVAVKMVDRAREAGGNDAVLNELALSLNP